MRMEEKKTNVMSEEEKRNFDGVTIDSDSGQAFESGDFPEVERRTYESARPRVKVYSFSGGGLLRNLILLAVVAAAVILSLLFGGIFLIGFIIVAIIGAILSFFGGL